MNLKYLNALSVAVKGNARILQKINDTFEGDFEHAWQSDLTKLLPRERDEDGQIISYDLAHIDPEREFAKLAREDIDIITIYDNVYPRLLKTLPDPPFLLYVRGSQKAWHHDSISVVGTRRATDYGKRATPHIVRDLVRAGFVITSGLAAGIDTLAHKSSLAEHGVTVAVLGCGVDDATIFPRSNLGLAHEIIAAGGAVISEYPVGLHGTRFTFPMRNRIISGLSRGTLVVEADIQSGSLITAKSALDQNRDVFAVPGNIFSNVSQGTNHLIKQGAKPVLCGQDILDEYQIQSQPLQLEIKPDNEEERKILKALSTTPMSIDAIIRKTGLETSQVTATIVVMELKKKIKNLGGNQFVAM